MKLVCTDNKGIEGNVKINQEFLVHEESQTHYKIRLGNGVLGTYKKYRFKEVEE